jgi:hypothetical protein
MSDNKPVISDEAVELAARAAAKDEDASNWDDEHEYYRNGWRNRVQVALEAAAPHLLAKGWDEGVAYVFEGGAEVHDENPYRSQA